MAQPTRRDMMVLSSATLAALPGMSAAADGTASDGIEDDLARYIGFGIKASGGPGDTTSGAWIENELRAVGYKVTRQAFDVPFFATTSAQLSVGGADIAVLPQPLVVPTAATGVTGPLVRVDPVSVGVTKLAGAMALIDLPSQRWSSALARPIADTLTRAWAGGAVAAIIVSNGPTGEAVALNTPADGKAAPHPVAILAPKFARPALLAAARGKSATLRITGQAGSRPAFNLIGRLDRGKGRWIAVSTPRSGWFGCAGERGSGLAVWLALARWAVAALPDLNLIFICNSGHEYEYFGSEKTFAAKLPPSPAETAFWLHLGANVAARDWQEVPGAPLLPLPSADRQRFLITSPALLPAARTAFAGLAGLEMPTPPALARLAN